MQYHDASVVFYKHCEKRLRKDEKHNKTHNRLYRDSRLPVIHSMRAKQLLDRAIKTHDHILETQGQFGTVHRCNSMAIRQHINNVKNSSSKDKTTPMPSRDISIGSFNISKPISALNPITREFSTKMIDKLCLGGQLRVG